MKPIILALLAVTCAFRQNLVAEDLTCLSAAERETAGLYARLQQEAFGALDRRNTAYEQLKTADEIRAYQGRLREFFVRQLGGFPERTPLNARTVRTINADGYRIECVVFESQPNHHVTANLYLPESTVPVPGVAVSSGHSRTGKAADYNQRFGTMMAKHGMAALCFDPRWRDQLVFTTSRVATFTVERTHGGLNL